MGRGWAGGLAGMVRPTGAAGLRNATDAAMGEGPWGCRGRLRDGAQRGDRGYWGLRGWVGLAQQPALAVVVLAAGGAEIYNNDMEDMPFLSPEHFSRRTSECMYVRLDLK